MIEFSITETDRIYINPDKVAYVSKYMGSASRTKIAFSENEKDYVVVQGDPQVVATKIAAMQMGNTLNEVLVMLQQVNNS